MKRYERFDAAALDELRARQLPKLRAADIATPAADATADQVAGDMAKLDEYCAHFAALGERDPAWGSRTCLCCGAPLSGLVGRFRWGLAHGEGECGACGYPARAIHRIEGIGTLSTVVFQYHPDELSFASEAPMP